MFLFFFLRWWLEIVITRLKNLAYVARVSVRVRTKERGTRVKDQTETLAMQAVKKKPEADGALTLAPSNNDLGSHLGLELQSGPFAQKATHFNQLCQSLFLS